ncbi:MAG: hypothetical protein M3209_08640 [Acidobacteriota bacterium]|nr:hypothetical protein [Acidobacteriota bacterium]
MKIKREIFTEQERSVTIRFPNQPTEQFCPVCQSASPFVTTDEAAIFCGMTSRAIFTLVEDKTLHSVETQLGLLLVCLNSLSAIKNSIF